MLKFYRNKQAISNIVFIISVALLVAICLASGFLAYYAVENLQKENNSLQQNVAEMQSSYDQVNSLLQKLFGSQISSTYSNNSFSAVAPSVTITMAEASNSMGEATLMVQNLESDRIFITGILLEDITDYKFYKLTLTGDNVGNFTYIGSDKQVYEQKAIAIQYGKKDVVIGTGDFFHAPLEMPFACRITLLTNLGGFDSIGFVQSNIFTVNS